MIFLESQEINTELYSKKLKCKTIGSYVEKICKKKSVGVWSICKMVLIYHTKQVEEKTFFGENFFLKNLKKIVSEI